MDHNATSCIQTSLRIYWDTLMSPYYATYRGWSPNFPFHIVTNFINFWMNSQVDEHLEEYPGWRTLGIKSNPLQIHRLSWSTGQQAIELKKLRLPSLQRLQKSVMDWIFDRGGEQMVVAFHLEYPLPSKRVGLFQPMKNNRILDCMNIYILFINNSNIKY